MAPNLDFLFLLLLLLLLLAAVPANADLTYIKSICAAATVHRSDLCVSSLLTHPRSLGCGDGNCIALASVEVGLMNASLITDYIGNLMAKSQPPPSRFESLRSCLNLYGLAVTDLNASIGYLGNKSQYSYTRAKYMVTAAQQMASQCQVGFKENPSPLTSVNQVFGDLCSISANLIQVVGKLNLY